jgi:hypothetical protein
MSFAGLLPDEMREMSIRSILRRGLLIPADDQTCIDWHEADGRKIDISHHK